MLLGLLRNKRVFFYLLAVVVSVAVWLVQSYIRAAAPAASGVISSTSLNGSDSSDTQAKADTQASAVTMYTTTTGLLTTLATALLGALGYVLMNGGQAKTRLSVAAMLSATFAFVSIYFGYRCDNNALWYVYEGAFTPGAAPLVWPKEIQFGSLLLAAFFFADYAFHELGKEPQHEKR
jgi:hypothetical protein